jgi:hypothetical protein
MKKLVYPKLPIPVWLLALMLLFLSSGNVLAQNNPLPRDVISSYRGWVGNPDSITVYIDDSFTAAEKDSVRVGMQRWNAAGGIPKFKEVSSKPGNVTVIKGNPGRGAAGVYRWRRGPDGKTISGTIIIRNNPNPGLVETATHEFGHAIGLDDVDQAANPGDVMKGSGPSNGTNGNLSQHDSTELRAAVASITEIADPADKKKVADFPDKASLPGQNSLIVSSWMNSTPQLLKHM